MIEANKLSKLGFFHASYIVFVLSGIKCSGISDGEGAKILYRIERVLYNLIYKPRRVF